MFATLIGYWQFGSCKMPLCSFVASSTPYAAVYRLAFGQPRQEDLISFLAEQRDGSAVAALQELQLNLAP